MSNLYEPALASGRYNGSQRVSWPAVGATSLTALVLLSAMMSLGVMPMQKSTQAHTIVEMIDLTPEPPAMIPAPQEETKQIQEDIPRLDVMAPVPLIQVPAAPSPVQTTEKSSPPVTVDSMLAEPSTSPYVAPPAPLVVGNLDSSMIDAMPPRYPLESRRHREQGTVKLLVVVGRDGRVAQLSIDRSSGFDRLDQAAMMSVRKWRWSPTVRDGQPMMVKGFVEIPFILKR